MGLLDLLFGSKSSDVNKQHPSNEDRLKLIDIPINMSEKCINDVLVCNTLINEANQILNEHYHLIKKGDITTIKMCTRPKTKTGRDPKHPYYLSFSFGFDNTGIITYDKDYNVVGASVTIWIDKEAVNIETGGRNNTIEVERIDKIYLPEGNKVRVYTKHPIKKSTQKNFKKFIPNERDIACQEEASTAYRNKIWNTYYKDFPEKPFISKDRELYTQWEEQMGLFPSFIDKNMMFRYKDGLLPGHVYMLYWLGKYRFGYRRIPVYFEYKYGIWFTKELDFLKSYDLIDENYKPTPKGSEKIKEHHDALE